MRTSFAATLLCLSAVPALAADGFVVERYFVFAPASHAYGWEEYGRLLSAPRTPGAMSQDIDLLGGHPVASADNLATPARTHAEGAAQVAAFVDDVQGYAKSASVNASTGHLDIEPGLERRTDTLTLAPGAAPASVVWGLSSHRPMGFDTRVVTLSGGTVARLQVPHGDDLETSGQVDVPVGKAAAVVVPDPSSEDGRGVLVFVVRHDDKVADAR